jgi:hypothetical protein
MAEDGGGRMGVLGRVLVICALIVGVSVPLGWLLRDAAPVADPADDPRELVVVIHGLGRSRVSMGLLAWRLEKAGYRVVNWGYSSTTHTLPELGAALSARVARETHSAPRVHFVGHSLGNIVVRWAVAHHRPARMGRVVMLAPPNQGAVAADRFTPYLGWFLRPLSELGTADSSTVRRLGSPPPDVEVAVIAGEHDGKVSLDEARLPGARAFAVVPAAHTFLMNRSDVADLVTGFLRDGTFPKTD